ncbi:GNAT family N-acetyltransferase [Cyclobacterium sp.]|uniref:GNAT family N-acetyltransferase n=1 Tax=Cyclobacterium sp. TaxID=1966343 RepID=UPI0019BAF0E4|nr:GNAT family N-acetyltransferase [Cyclobacterium sp.]MBD3629503.1 GNAT family N-acetyltransferase [Cyclobacterium sp.]
MFIERLEWDSNFFGYEIGRLIIKDPEEFQIVEFENEAKNFKLVYLISSSEFNFEKLKLVDKKVIFRQDKILDIKPPLYKNKIVSYNKNSHDEIQLINLTLESGKYSRFNIDKGFKNNEYFNLYRSWIQNSISGKLAFEILITLDVNKITGFATLAKKDDDLADIGLLAVDKDYRGRGIATELVLSAIEKAKEEKFRSIQVVTQMDNKPAIKLYTKTNFLIKEISNIYHYWNYDTF